MRLNLPARVALVALLLSFPAMGQGEAAAVPHPPSAEVLAQLEPARLEKEQVALKEVWLSRLICAREERNRITRENVADSALLALKLGAPEGFAASLRRVAVGNLSPRERYEQENCQQAFLDAYGVDAREMRFFVEACGLTPAELREVVAWLPLASLFNLPSVPAEELSVERLRSDFVATLAAHRDAAQLLRPVVDRASADAAAEALLPVLLRAQAALPSLVCASEELRRPALAPLSGVATLVEDAFARECERVKQAQWYGSARLQALDYLLR